MNRYQNKSGVSLVTAAVAAALYWGSGSVAYADEAAESATGNSSDAAGVEQVVVTARRREESL